MDASANGFGAAHVRAGSSTARASDRALLAADGAAPPLEMQDQILELQRRVAALEEYTFRKHRLKLAIEEIINAWPGPFTVQQIETALRETRPEIGAELQIHTVSNKVTRLEKAGLVTRWNQGSGPVAGVFERVGPIPNKIGRPGPTYNRRAKYESGFRAIVRRALDDLPAEFGIADLREWMAANMPDVQIPYGSWSSTLYKLTQSEELICVKGKRRPGPAKAFKRGPKRVLPSGEELREMEAAWEEFRNGLNLPAPAPDWTDGLTQLQRGGKNTRAMSRKGNSNE